MFFHWLSKLFRKEHTWALHEIQEFLGLAYLNCNSQCKIFCSWFLGFPGVSMSCFSMKARNFHTWHSHSCLSWLFWVRFVGTKSTLSAKAQSLLLAFQALLGRTFRSFQESQEFPCFPGFSRLSSVQKSREKPRKPGSPGFSGVSALFLAFFGKGGSRCSTVDGNKPDCQVPMASVWRPSISHCAFLGSSGKRFPCL